MPVSEHEITSRVRVMKSRSAEAERSAPRILIIKRSSLGDVVHALPVACALRDTYPEAYLAWMAETRFAGVLEGHPALDNIIAVERFPGAAEGGRIIDGLRTGRELRRLHFDWALDLQWLCKSSIFLVLSGARRRIGMSDQHREYSHLWCTEFAPEGQRPHAVWRYLQVAEYLGCDISSPRFDLRPTAQASEWAQKMLSEAGIDLSRPLVGLNPGASRTHKQWPSQRFADLANTKPPVQWVLLGGPSEVEMAHRISSQIASTHLVTAGLTSLPQLVGIIGRLDAMVTGDTGPMHIAAAMTVPTVALFGPTDPDKCGPFGDFHHVLSHPELCSEGGRRPSCRRRPPCRDYACILSITVDEVAAALSGMLERSQANSTTMREPQALSDRAE